MPFLPFSEILGMIENPSDKAASLKFLETNEALMKEMPASVNHHHRYPGGYYDHILEVCNNGFTLLNSIVLRDLPPYEAFSLDDLILSTFFHDVDKLFYRYILETDKPSEAQVKFALGVGAVLTDFETRSTISAKIDAAKAGRPVDPKDVGYHKYKEGLSFDDGALVAKICAQNNIILSDPALAAVSQHHGGWAPIMKASGAAKMSSLGTLLHSADLISTFCQNGRTLSTP